MSAMVDRVAKRIAMRLAVKSGAVFDEETMRVVARSAIAEIGEPTFAMHTAGQELICEALERGEVATVSDVWRVMSAQALKD